MWAVTVVCSDCEGESEVMVDDLDELERAACPCGYALVVLAIAGCEPVLASTRKGGDGDGDG